MKVFVTGGDGFVGQYLVRRLTEHGHEVVAGCRPGTTDNAVSAAWRMGASLIPLELGDPESIRAAVDPGYDAVVHLAAIASVREAHSDPGRAWEINAAGTARLVNSIQSSRELNGSDPVVLIVSTAEVYGCGPERPRAEHDAARPQSTYAASKLGAEIAALEVGRRAGLRTIIARPFTHTGPGQSAPYVVPSFIARLQGVKSGEDSRVPTGNLSPVRDFLDVRDVVEAYLALLVAGVPGEIYNIARGQGISLVELFQQLADLIGVPAVPVPDPGLRRRGDIPHLVGDSRKLRQVTGWSPTIPLEQTLRDMVNAQAH
jgi:nucleoside-diphosphate-sugar epimerase